MILMILWALEREAQVPHNTIWFYWWSSVGFERSKFGECTLGSQIEKVIFVVRECEEIGSWKNSHLNQPQQALACFSSKKNIFVLI